MEIYENNLEAELDFQAERKFIWTFAILGVLMVSTFIHASQWDRHFMTVIPLKVKNVFGANSIDDLNRLAEICAERMKYHCQEKSLTEIAVKSPQDIGNWVKLGNIRRLLGDYDGARTAYLEHIERGGIDMDVDAPYFLAKIYDLQQQIAQAKLYYEMALDQKPHVIQTTVVHAYVNMLMRSGDYNHAKKVIESVRRKSPTARYFMATEFDEIKKRLTKG